MRDCEILDPTRGYLYILSKKRAEFRPTPDGEFAVWEEPNPEHVYVVGADVAEGLAHGDYSSAHVINANTLEVVAHWHGHIEPDLYGDLLPRLAIGITALCLAWRTTTMV